MIIIIRADLAFNFTTTYLEEFENCTKKEFAFLKDVHNILGYENGITACAGISYIQNNYPFHYGVRLANKLTDEAKGFSKSIPLRSKETYAPPPSSLSFYKVQSSFTESVRAMKKRTLYAEATDVHFNCGPYLLNPLPGFYSIKDLTDALETLDKQSNEDSKGISKLRQWISELYKNEAKASFMMDRMSIINPKLYEALKLKEEREKESTIIFELLQLHRFKKQEHAN